MRESVTQLTQGELHQFTGSQQFYRHHFNRAVIYTEGVQYVAEKGKAYWLVDAIASHVGSRQFNLAAKQDDRISLIHFWKLAVDQDEKSAVLTARADQGVKPFVTQNIPSTDFPLDEVDFYCQQNELGGYTLMLPSEY